MRTRRSRRTPRPPKGLPKQLLEYAGWMMLARYANGLAAFYSAPVYLVGGALKPGNSDPRDYDIRVILPDSEFRRRYGDPERWKEEGSSGNYSALRWRWSDDCVHKTRQGWRDTRLNIDFQVYPASWDKMLYADKRKLRIDTRGRRQSRQ